MSSKMGLQVYLKWLLHSEEPRDRAVSAKPEGTSGSCGVCYWEVYMNQQVLELDRLKAQKWLNKRYQTNSSKRILFTALLEIDFSESFGVL